MSAYNYRYSFEFKENEFLLRSTQDDSLQITSLTPSIYIDRNAPSIPFVSRSLAFVNNERVVGYKLSLNKRIIKKDIVLKKPSIVLPTNVSDPGDLSYPGEYDLTIYPDSNFIMGTNYKITGINIVNFIISPFVYDVPNRLLYFIDSIDVELDLEDEQTSRDIIFPHAHQLDFISDMIENKEVLASIPAIMSEEYDNETIEYLIITNRTLKDVFMPLVDWKTKKGVNARIITTEEIYNTYSGETPQIKIKTCIKDYNENYGTQYVLLGGDVNVVPAQLCYVLTGTKVIDNKGYHNAEDYIPADVYYSATIDLNWDKNKDGKHGDYLDQISVIPIVNVTRIPVRTLGEAEIFVNRTISYEKDPYIYKAFLQTGTKLDEESETTGEKYANALFNEVINGKIYFERFKLFDSKTSVSITDLNSEFEKGYQFVEVISHGTETKWCDANENDIFNTQYATSLVNDKYTLITTTACYTNAFDGSGWNSCLSEAFVRNPKSGVIGFLGSSRYGWFTPGNYDMEFSIGYDYDFYRRLLNTNTMKPYEKNFGKIVSYTKRSLLGFVSSEINDPTLYRWLHYSINAIGDPEMPIYNTNPLNFECANADYDRFGLLNVETGEDDARVCVSSINSNDYYEIKYGNNVEFLTGDGQFDIWITKQNFIPKHFKVVFKFPEYFEKDEDRSKTSVFIYPNPATDLVRVTYSSPEDSYKEIELIGINHGGVHRYIFDLGTSHKTIDVSDIANDIYILRAYENGVLVDSNNRLVKQ